MLEVCAALSLMHLPLQPPILATATGKLTVAPALVWFLPTPPAHICLLRQSDAP